MSRSSSGAVPPGDRGASPATDRRGLALAATLLVLAVLVAFRPALDAGFVNFDDDVTVIDNLDHLGFGGEQLAWMASTFREGHYQPLTWLSLAVDRALWGDGPFGFHLDNVLLHAVAAVLVLLLARRLLDRAAALRARPPGPDERGLRTGAALFAAVVFALHPLRVESVAWVTERRDVLSVTLLLGAVLAWLGARAHAPGTPGDRRGRRAFVGLLALSLLANAWAATLPAVLLVLEAWPLGGLLVARRDRAERRRLLRSLALITPPCALVLGAAAWAQTAVGATRSWSEHGLLARLAQAAYGLVFYPVRTLAPADLSPLHPLGARLDPSEPRFLLAGGLVLLVALLLLIVARRRPWWAVAALTYAILLSPVLGLAQSGPQLVAERYSYLALVPLALLAGGGALVATRALARRAGPGLARSASGVAIVLLALLLGGATRARCAVWHDSITLWSDAVRVVPDSGFVRYDLGKALADAGRDGEALVHLRVALDHLPPDRAGRVAVLETTGAVLGNLDRLDEARTLWLRALDLEPDHVPVLADLAVAARLQARDGEARSWALRALAAADRRAREAGPDGPPRGDREARHRAWQVLLALGEPKPRG